MLRDELGVVLKFIPMLPDGTLDLAYAESSSGAKTKLLTVTAMANALGTIVPVDELTAMARKVGALVLVDGAQSVPHLPQDVQALDIDFLAFSSHKMLGPTGVGVLWARAELLEEMNPFMTGGEMILTVTLERSTWSEPPNKFEAGTPNIAGAIGLGAAVDYLSELGMRNVRAHEREIVEYAMRRLADTPGVEVFGPPEPEQRGGVVSFALEDVHPHDVGQVLDSYGVAIRAGHHCAQPVMAALNVPATARASFYIYNTKQEVDTLVGAVEEAGRYFGGRRG
jgi:cysteine desulfurase/selenocysteine lyase